MPREIKVVTAELVNICFIHYILLGSKVGAIARVLPKPQYRFALLQQCYNLIVLMVPGWLSEFFERIKTGGIITYRCSATNGDEVFQRRERQGVGSSWANNQRLVSSPPAKPVRAPLLPIMR